MSPRRLKSIVREFYSVASKPMQYASLFYVYYYLVEVEDTRELKKRFVELCNKLEEAFYWYGIYSCSEHLSYATEGILVFGEGVYEEGYELKDLLKIMHGTIEKRVMEYSEYISERLRLFEGRGKGLEFVTTNCIDAEETIKCFSNPSLFLEVAELWYGLNKENTNGMCWWEEGFGGESWAKICRTLNRKSAVNRTMFVDACWGMHHNTGIWLNYIFLERKDDDAVESEKALKILDDLEKLLDDNFEGSMDKVFDVAVTWDKDLERFRRLIME